MRAYKLQSDIYNYRSKFTKIIIITILRLNLNNILKVITF